MKKIYTSPTWFQPQQRKQVAQQQMEEKQKEQEYMQEYLESDSFKLVIFTVLAVIFVGGYLLLDFLRIV